MHLDAPKRDDAPVRNVFLPPPQFDPFVHTPSGDGVFSRLYSFYSVFHERPAPFSSNFTNILSPEDCGNLIGGGANRVNEVFLTGVVIAAFCRPF